DAQITIDRVQLEPVWAGLWHGELHLRRIVLATLDITLDGADSAPLDPANLRAPVLPTIRLPVSIRVDALLVEALRVKQRGESVFDGHLAAVLAADEAGLNLSSLSMSGTPWRVQARGFLPFTPQGALQWQTDWARVDDAEPLAGELKLAGRLEKIEFEHR
ncbi:MAG: hypothetical protein KDI42_09945, partial [Gammaproteobacteria bacterium]|nr:hypothetical protein [Gammaproteobacteria bacterium]